MKPSVSMTIFHQLATEALGRVVQSIEVLSKFITQINQ